MGLHMSINFNIQQFYKVILLLFAGSIFTNFEAKAVSDFEITLYMQSLNNLPAYCQHKIAETRFRNECTDINGRINWPQKFGKSRSHWERYIGSQNWIYIHHYCFGIREFMDYSRMNNEDKGNNQHKLVKAIEEFEFMRVSKTSNFRFWYDLYRYEAYIYMLLGNTSKAEWALKKSKNYGR